MTTVESGLKKMFTRQLTGQDTLRNSMAPKEDKTADDDEVKQPN